MQLAEKKTSLGGKTLILLSALFLSLMAFYGAGIGVDNAYAADTVQDAINKAGLSSSAAEEDGLLDEGKALIYTLMAFGGLVIVGCLIIAAVKFAGSSGNSQKRSEAIMWIVGCFIGVWIVYKAFDLAGWAVNIGS